MTFVKSCRSDTYLMKICGVEWVKLNPSNFQFKATNRIPEDWGADTSFHNNNPYASPDDVTVDLMPTSSIPLERRISLLHNAIEGVLEALSRLLVKINKSDVNVTSSAPCDVTLSDLSLLFLKMPQAYICENQS